MTMTPNNKQLIVAQHPKYNNHFYKDSTRQHLQNHIYHFCLADVPMNNAHWVDKQKRRLFP